MYIIEILIKITDKNEERHSLMVVDEDSHTDNYIEHIYNLIGSCLSPEFDNEWSFECGPLDDTYKYDDECTFYLNTEQIQVVFDTLRSKGRLPANNFLETMQMLGMMSTLRQICESSRND